MDPAQLVPSLRNNLARALVALDFDGTLAPIVLDPGKSRIAAGGLEVLVRLAQRGAHIGIVTGRDADTVVRLGQLDAVPGLIVAGLYGMERWQDAVVTRPPTPEAIHRLRAQLPATVAQYIDDPGVRIEDKGLSLVVHTRRARDPASALATVRGPVVRLAQQLGFEAHPGRDVIEIRAGGYDKGRALRELISGTQPAALLYAGDDVGDLPAFAAVEQARSEGVVASGWTVGVLSDEVPELAAAVDVRVGSPAELVALLAELVA